MSKKKYVWVVYDSRAETMPTDDCSIYVTADSLEEAKMYIKENFLDGVVFRCELKNGIAINETRELI
jgi:hypothetical protein